MTVMYYLLPAGEPTRDLRALLPDVINPQRLTAEELADRGIARCLVVTPTLEWWQQRGARQIDASTTPHMVTWTVEDRPLAAVQEIAWERVKFERAARRAAGVEHMFPDGAVGHIQIRDEDFGNLLAIHAAATSAMLAGASAPIPFTDREDITRWLEPHAAMSVAMAAFAHGAAVHVTSQDIRAAILAAETVAEVVTAAQWPEG